MRFSCLLIGQENLLIQCATLLLEAQHQIKWVVSKVEFIQEWCDKNNIPWVESIHELSQNKANQVDYLFSIVNGTILKKDEIDLACIAAINYHDSLLPQYAGVHATNWALLNGETTHGITWHLINEGIDEGDIIYQSSFPILKNDTALTLNLRCFQEAAAGFSKIIKQIETATLERSKQPSEGRSYYEKTKALPHLGFLDWENQDAASIERYCRALNFGNYVNSIGTLKLYLGARFLIVTELEIVELSHPTLNSGTILENNEKGVLIATSSVCVLLKKLKNLHGKVLSCEELIHEYQLTPHTQLPLISQQELQKNQPLYSQCLSHENYWVSQLLKNTEHSIYTERLFDKERAYTQIKAITVQTPHSLKYPLATYWAASVLLYLYRMNNYEPSTTFFTSLNLDNRPHEPCLFSTLMPITPSWDSDARCSQILDWVTQTITKLDSQGLYLNDVYIRHPRLYEQSQEPLITLSLKKDSKQTLHSMLHFEITEEKLCISHRLNTHYQKGTFCPLIENMPEHLENIMQHLLTKPETLIHQFTFLTKAEKNKLMTWGVGDYIPYPCHME